MLMTHGRRFKKYITDAMKVDTEKEKFIMKNTTL